MLDEVRPVSRIWLIDRVRFGERYLRYNLDDIINMKSFNNLRDIKIIRDHKKNLEKAQKKSGGAEKHTDSYSYDSPNVPKNEPHDIDKLI